MSSIQKRILSLSLSEFSSACTLFIHEVTRTNKFYPFSSFKFEDHERLLNSVRTLTSISSKFTSNVLIALIKWREDYVNTLHKRTTIEKGNKKNVTKHKSLVFHQNKNLIEFLFTHIVEELLNSKEKKVIPRVIDQIATLSLVVCVESDKSIKEENILHIKNKKTTNLIIVQSNIRIIIEKYFKLISILSQGHLKLIGNKLFGLLNKSQSHRLEYLNSFQYIYLDISTNLGLRTSTNFLNVIENFFIKLKSNKKERSVFAFSVSKFLQRIVSLQKFEKLDYTLWYQNIKPFKDIANELLKSRKEIESGLHLYTAVLSVSGADELINNFDNFLKIIRKFLKDKSKKYIVGIECLTNICGIYLNIIQDINNKITNRNVKDFKQLLSPILQKIFPIKKKSNYVFDKLSLHYLEKLIKILSDWDLHFVMENIIFKILPPDRNNLQQERILLGLKLIVSILIKSNSNTKITTTTTATVSSSSSSSIESAKSTGSTNFKKMNIINKQYSSQLIKIIEQNFLQINKNLGNYYIFTQSVSKMKSRNEFEQKKKIIQT